ncbi:unnamed protein product, partial [Meganyctiphanes norvegica]
MAAADRWCVPDLQKERANCPFDKEEITQLIDGGEEKTILRRKLEKFFLQDPEFDDPVPPDYLSYKDKYENELRKATHMIRKFQEDEEIQTLVGEMEGISELVKTGNSVPLSAKVGLLRTLYIMQMIVIYGDGEIDRMNRSVADMRAKLKYNCYPITEMGHGTFLRGLETTATYDPTSEEFVLHSPTITATKWWPGGLGKTVNYAIVMAQLYTKGKCHGPHPFIVQLRAEETHQSMPGVTLGEIGPRLGMNTNDNGFLRLDHVRIPRTQMLMKHSQVLEDGTYVKPANEKLAYGTMVFVRVAICFDAARQLMRACTIATRYAAVRHQSEIIPGEPEPQIIDYQTQQYKLLPHIASVFAIQFSANVLFSNYNNMEQYIQEGNLELLPALHALSCGMKAMSSMDGTRGVDIMRLGCGGHGYLSSSNLPRIYGTQAAAQTYEGENTVMWLQVARYLIKSYREARKGRKLHHSVAYLTAQPASTHARNDVSNQALVNAYKTSVSSMIADTEARLQQFCDMGEQFEHAWNKCSVLLTQCAEAHTRYFVCEEFVKSINNYSGSDGVRTVLGKLCRLYLLYQITNNQGQFVRCGALSDTQLTILEEEMGDLLETLRKDAVNLVDSFDVHDKILDSTLGAWDGDVYNRLYNEALKSPLNQKDVTDAYHKYLKPLMKANL